MPYVEYDEVGAACSECGRIFQTEEALEAHRAESHGIQDVTTAPARGAPRRPSTPR